MNQEKFCFFQSTKNCSSNFCHVNKTNQFSYRQKKNTYGTRGTMETTLVGTSLERLILLLFFFVVVVKIIIIMATPEHSSINVLKIFNLQIDGAS